VNNTEISSVPYVKRTIQFLCGLGLCVSVEEEVHGFVPHIRIDHGALVVDRQCPVSNLLHEAGHLAVAPARYRRSFNADLYASMHAMLADLAAREIEPDSPEYRAAIQCSDPEVTAWAWAAGAHLGIPPEAIIQDGEYEGEGEGLRTGLALGAYVGIHGLAHAGFCCTREDLVAYTGLPAYPRLAFWLQR
jgi:hypothetical protein